MKGLSTKAQGFIIGMIAVGAGLTVWHLSRLDFQNLGLIPLATLAALAQILKVEGATARSSYNISWLVYGLTFLLLGTPAAFFVILISHLVEWAWHRYSWYIQSFNIASYAMAISSAGLVFGWINGNGEPFGPSGAAGILAALATFTFINHLLVGLVIWLARGQNFSQSGVFGFFTLTMDFTLIGLGAATGMVWLINPFASILNVIPLYLIYSTLKVPALQRQTEIDPKTKLYNARFFAQALEKELARAERFERPLTVVLADLDLLRNINNTYGHLAGDVVLIGIANILKEAFRDYDVVARFGGEEYAILLPETTPEQALPRIEQVRQEIEATDFEVSTSVTPIQATISFGLAGREKPGQTASEIIHNADVALYRAKLSGRNCTCVYNGETVEGLFTGLEVESSPVAPEGLKSRLETQRTPFQPNPLRGKQPPPLSVQETQPIATVKPRPTWVLTAYIAGLFLLSLALFSLLFHPSQDPDWLGLTTFALIVLLTEGLSIDLYVRDNSVSTSTAPLLAGILLFGPVAALILSLVLAATAALKHRSQPIRFLFNMSNHLLASSLAVGLLMLTQNPLASHPTLLQIALVVATAELMYLSSTACLAGVLHISTGDSLSGLWKQRFRWLWPYYLGLGMGAYALIFGYEASGLVGVLAVLTPLLILRLSQVQYIQQTKEMVSQLRSQNLDLENSAREISSLNEELLLALANVIDIRDPNVLGHSQQVAHYAVLVAEQLKLPARKVEQIRKAALLHDIGKLGISEAILFKPGRLTAEEYDQVKEHPVLGAEIVAGCHTLQSLIPIIRHHHERFDGQGYPDGLDGQTIPLEARIVGLADALEAMASDRPYRSALTWPEIRRELQNNSGTQFDPIVVEALLQVVDRHGDEFLVNSARASDPLESMFLPDNEPALRETPTQPLPNRSEP